MADLCGRLITGIYGSEETNCVRDAGHGGGHHSVFGDGCPHGYAAYNACPICTGVDA